MKLTKEVEYKLILKAVLNDEGELRMSLSAAAPYGNRTATATVNDFPEELVEKVTAVLNEIMESQAARMIDLAENAAAVSRMAAVSLGEEI